MPSWASVTANGLRVLLAVRVGADAVVAVITVIRMATTNGMGMVAMLRAMNSCMANTHSVVANAHDDVHLAGSEKSAFKLNSDGLRSNYACAFRQ